MGATGLPPRRNETPTATISLEPRRRELAARVAELQWDLGGLVYEMAIRDHIRVELLIQRAAVMQALDAELGEVERLMRMEQAGAAGACRSCDALHSRGAAYCWQCGKPIVERSNPPAAEPTPGERSATVI
jgi:chorismate mutase